MCIGIIWNNSFLVGGRARAEARIDPRPLQTSRSTAHGAKVAWPLDYMGRARSLKADKIMSSWSSLTPNRSVSSFSNDYSRQLVSTASQHGYRRLDTQLLVYPLGVRTARLALQVVSGERRRNTYGCSMARCRAATLATTPNMDGVSNPHFFYFCQF